MKRIAGLTLALLLTLALVPQMAQAQTPRANEFTREAENRMAMAMIRSDAAEKARLYQEALDAALEGLRADPTHALLWQMAGDAHVGVGNFTEALDAYRKAVEFYPEYESEVAEKREAAWVEAFNAGVAHLQANEFEAAAEDMAAAHGFYKGRPEAMFYLGGVHAQLGNLEDAGRYYRELLTFLDSPAARTTLEEEPEKQAEWDEFRATAENTLTQLQAADAVAAYQSGDYDAAVAGFRQQLQANPYDRDMRFMVFTGLYEKARGMLPQLQDATPEEQASQLDPLFADIVAEGERLLRMDPANSAVLQILAQVRTARSRYQATEEAQAALRNEALAILTQREELPVFLDQVGVTQTSASSADVQGGVIGNTAQAGSTVRIRMTLLGEGGTEVGAKVLEVTAPAPNDPIGFTDTIPVSGPVVGWKYEIVS